MSIKAKLDKHGFSNRLHLEMENELTQAEKTFLLDLARRAIGAAIQGGDERLLDDLDLPARLKEKGASFVTITKNGQLRGCIGAIEPYQSLAADVYQHAVAAALEDYRFPPVSSEEIEQITIEISRLSKPVELSFSSPEELLSKLQPGIDGVIIRDGSHRATFLPQVWEKLPEKIVFLEHLCMKMGAAPDFWKTGIAQLFKYQVEKFHE